MAPGYTRQSSGLIITGATILAAHFNNEYNQLASAFDNTVGHTHDGSVAGSGGPLSAASLAGLTSSSAGIIAANGSNGLNARTITGTTAQIAVTNGTGVSGNPTIAIDAGYLGQSSITTLGTIVTGIWNGTAITAAYGGTGANSLTAHSIIIGNGTGTALGLAPGTSGNICISNGTDWTSSTPSTITTLSGLASVGTLTVGVWNATKIGLAYGGTNADLSATGGASQVLKQNSTGGNITVGQLAASDLSNSTTGSGNVVLATSPTLVTPVLGAATATSINKVAFTAPATAATLTIGNNKTLTCNASLTFTGTDGTTITFQGTDTYVGRATTDTLTNKTLTAPVISSIVNTGTLTLPTSTDTLVGKATTDILTNKTYDTAGTGNAFSINGQSITAVSGNTTKVATVTGALTSGHIATWDASGNLQDGGASGITKGTSLTVNPYALATHTSTAHGLGATPTYIFAYLECLSAEGGYSVGDRIAISSSGSGNSQGDPNWTFAADSTNVYITLFDSLLPILLNRGSGALFTITAAKWKVVATPVLI